MKFTLEDVFIYLDHIALGEEAEEILERSGDKISRAVSEAVTPEMLPGPEQVGKLVNAIAITDDVNKALRAEVDRCKSIYLSLPEDDEITEVVTEAICYRVLAEEISGERRPADERFEISIEELFRYFDHEAQAQLAETVADRGVYDALLEELSRCRKKYRILPRHEEIIDELLFAIYYA